MKLIIPRALICFSLLFLFGKVAIAQDTIIKIDSTRILGTVEGLDSANICYKEFGSDETSPGYQIARNKVNIIKYADGTEQVITPLVTKETSFVYSTHGSFSATVTNAFLYFGATGTPYSSYSGGSTINSYWQSLYSYQKVSGTMQLNSGKTSLFGCFLGATIVVNDRSNLSYEFQFATTPNNIIHNSASYPDGTNGSFSMWYMLFNNTVQYTLGLDSLNSIQVGAEAGLDINAMFGSESDAFYSTNALRADSTRGVSYDGIHAGAHIAVLGKYFVGKSRKLGFELKAGYSFLRAFAPDPRFPHPEIQTTIDLNGPFLTLGVLYRLKISYCTDCPTPNY